MAFLILSWTASAAAQGAGPGTVTVGTAFFIGLDGTAVTAAHVVEGCKRMQVASPTLAPAEADLIAAEDRSDLALLRVATARVPGVIGTGAGARVPGLRVPGLRVLGYGGTVQAPLQEAQPRVLTARVRVRSADPRFRIWLQDDSISHGWSGGPILANGRLAGVLLELLPDPAETARVFGRPERGVAAGTDAAAVAALLAHAGVKSDAPFGPPRDAVARVFCWR